MRRLRCFGVLPHVAITVAGQVYEQIIDQLAGGATPDLCNSTFAHANGTGVRTFNPQFVMAKQNLAESANDPIPDASWAVTVKQYGDNNDTWTNFWFAPNGVEYWNDELTQFDACALMIAAPLPENTINLSQDDPGDCSVMLTASCREALVSQVEAEALLLTSYASPGEYSNLTASSLPYICTHIFGSLVQQGKTNANLPKECDQDFGIPSEYGPTTNWGSQQDLTGNNISASGLAPAYDNCPIAGPDGKKYYSTFGFTVGKNWYDVAMKQATPLLTVYFTVANAAARLNIASYASAQLNCLRVTDVVQGSRTAPSLPSGTPYSSSGLSAGDIAGIVVGSLAFFAILVAAVFLFVRRRHRRGIARRYKTDNGAEKSSSSHEPGEVAMAELSTKQHKSEVDGAQVLELKGADTAAEMDASRSKTELDGNTNIMEVEGANRAVELDANPRWSFDTSRASIASYNTAASAI